MKTEVVRYASISPPFYISVMPYIMLSIPKLSKAVNTSMTTDVGLYFDHCCSSDFSISLYIVEITRIHSTIFLQNAWQFTYNNRKSMESHDLLHLEDT